MKKSFITSGLIDSTALDLGIHFFANVISKETTMYLFTDNSSSRRA